MINDYLIGKSKAIRKCLSYTVIESRKMYSYRVFSRSHRQQFFGAAFQHQEEIKKRKQEKRISQEAIVTVRASGLVSRTKIGDFLKRPFFSCLKLECIINAAKSTI